MKPKQKDDRDSNPMDEAYKLLEGTPSATGVSDAAQGLAPKNDDEDFRDKTEEINERRIGTDTPKEESVERPSQCLDDAYAMLFESLAVIMKSK